MANGEQSAPGSGRPTQARLAILAVVIVAVAVGTWLLVKGNDNEGKPAAQAQSKSSGFPVIMSLDGLRTFAGTLANDVYWVGPRTKLRYEVTQTSDGNVYVRYVSPGVQAGDRRAIFLTVGSYPQPKPFDTLRQASKRPGAIVRRLSGGGLSVANARTPKSVYLAYRRSRLLIEVYDPNPKVARQLVAAGRVKPVV